MTSETDISSRIRLAVPRTTVLFRNNVGSLEDSRGRWVRFGLCQGSSDLIGWTVRDGRAIFTAIECKTARGRLTPDQIRFLAAVERAGGIAIVGRSEDDVLRQLENGRGK